MKAKFFLGCCAIAIAISMAAPGPDGGFCAGDPAAALREHLRFRIEAGGIPLALSVQNEPVHAAVVLPAFYERRIYQPAWTGAGGPLPRARFLVEAIRRADLEGLTPEDYHLEKIEALLAQLEQRPGSFENSTFPRLVDLDLLLTDAFLIYGSHLLSGRTNPELIDPQWVANRREADLARLLEETLDSNRIEEALAGLLPAYDGYRRLRDALAVYRRLAAAGGWPTIEAGEKLKKGDSGERVRLLRQRLAAEGFGDGAGGVDPFFFDDGLELRLKRYQLQGGLEPDGILGPQTLQALNVPVGQRIRQIIANMERWRWLPQELGERHVLVNIAGFYLDVVERQQRLLSMRVVAGRTYRKTPVFSDKITYLVVNPHWSVPDKIAREDLLPKQKKNPKYLTDQKIRVFRGWDGESRQIDPGSIDWTGVSAAGFPYRFKQDPGPSNALGRVKFMFPNKFDVYLHDTPAKELFARARRDFSSGCIRVEKPFELAAYLLRGHPGWPAEKVRSALSGSDFTTETVKLPEPVNVHILYWTAWAGESGGIHFTADVYDRDGALDAALRKPPPRK